MPTVTELRDAIVSEMLAAVGGDFSAISDDFRDGIATAFAEAIQPHLGGGEGYAPLAEWNETDTTQFTMVKGNGNGGVGTPGDWSLSASTFPGSDFPALEVTTNNGILTEAIWLLDDTVNWTRAVLDFAATADSGGGGKKIDLGVLLYYEDNDHYYVLRQANSDDLYLWGQNGASGNFVGAQVVNSIAENNSLGDWFRLWSRFSPASGSEAPWATCVADCAASGSIGSNRGALLASAADADWLSLGTYTPRVGIWARSMAATPDTEYMTFRYLPDG